MGCGGTAHEVARWGGDKVIRGVITDVVAWGCGVDLRLCGEGCGGVGGGVVGGGGELGGWVGVGGFGVVGVGGGGGGEAILGVVGLWMWDLVGVLSGGSVFVVVVVFVYSGGRVDVGGMG